jgi:ribulose-phosphate 3-epimerase
MSEIIPAILAKSVKELQEKVSSIPEEIKIVHIDVLEDDVWININRDFEVHLMVQEPEKIIDRWIERGAKRVIVHSFGDRAFNIDDVEMGLAVELHVPLEEVFPLVPRVDFLQLMSIKEIGEQGHLFEPVIFDRIKKVKERFPEVLISVDGGIKIANYNALEDAGVARVVVGSGFEELWKSLTKN